MIFQSQKDEDCTEYLTYMMFESQNGEDCTQEDCKEEDCKEDLTYTMFV